MVACDRQSLVVPILGLYGELLRKKNSSSNVAAFLEEIECNRDEIFPPEFQLTIAQGEGKHDLEERAVLFGDLVERMQRHARDHLEEKTRRASRVSRSKLSSDGPSFNISHGAIIRHGGGKSSIDAACFGAESEGGSADVAQV